MSGPPHFDVMLLQLKNVLLEHCYNQTMCYITKNASMLYCCYCALVSGNNISNFRMFDIKTLYLSVFYTVQNTSGCLRYYLRTRYDISFLKMEMDWDRVWYTMKKVVTLQGIPNVTYKSNQTYKTILVK